MALITKMPASSDAQAREMLTFADGALGAAGHQVTDPKLLEIGERFARGEISGDEARDLSRKHVLGR